MAVFLTKDGTSMTGGTNCLAYHDAEVQLKRYVGKCVCRCHKKKGKPSSIEEEIEESIGL